MSSKCRLLTRFLYFILFIKAHALIPPWCIFMSGLLWGNRLLPNSNKSRKAGLALENPAACSFHLTQLISTLQHIHSDRSWSAYMTYADDVSQQHSPLMWYTSLLRLLCINYFTVIVVIILFTDTFHNTQGHRVERDSYSKKNKFKHTKGRD